MRCFSMTNRELAICTFFLREALTPLLLWFAYFWKNHVYCTFAVEPPVDEAAVGVRRGGALGRLLPPERGGVVQGHPVQRANHAQEHQSR